LGASVLHVEHRAGVLSECDSVENYAVDALQLLWTLEGWDSGHVRVVSGGGPGRNTPTAHLDAL
jgi:hypothetical protein